MVLVLGLANLVADGFAMGAGNYIGTKAEWDDYQRLLAVERKHIGLVPEGEREEIRQIFAAKGFAGGDLERIGLSSPLTRPSGRRPWRSKNMGFRPRRNPPLLAGLNTFCAFLLCGLVLLVTYLLAGGFLVCVVATGCTFIAIGAIKSRWSLSNWWQSATETFLIGMSAAALAFAVGFGLRIMFNLPAA